MDELGLARNSRSMGIRPRHGHQTLGLFSILTLILLSSPLGVLSQLNIGAASDGADKRSTSTGGLQQPLLFPFFNRNRPPPVSPAPALFSRTPPGVSPLTLLLGRGGTQQAVRSLPPPPPPAADPGTADIFPALPDDEVLTVSLPPPPPPLTPLTEASQSTSKGEMAIAPQLPAPPSPQLNGSESSPTPLDVPPLSTSAQNSTVTSPTIPLPTPPQNSTSASPQANTTSPQNGTAAAPPVSSTNTTKPAASPNLPPTGGAPKRPYTLLNVSFSTITTTQPEVKGFTIPQGFMGLSHEWQNIEELWDIPEYPTVLKVLASWGSGPIVMRIGGGSTDMLDYVPGPHVWESLRKVYEFTGVKFIIGVNFFHQNATLTRGQMEAAQKYLPADAIINFELGNEPNYFINKRGASGNDYVRCCFVQDWLALAQELSCVNNDPNNCTPNLFSGPAWGHIFMWPSTMQWYLSQTAKFVELTTIHWYKATAETYNTAATLLDEDPIRSEMSNLEQIVKVSNNFGKPLRVAETNTISNSGRMNVSNVFAAALWTLDASLEVAQAGAVGVNFHQGAGQNLYSAVIRFWQNGRLAMPNIRPPFYGMLMFQMAVGKGSRLIGRYTASGTSKEAYKLLKVWALEDLATGELRWVIINKDPSRAATSTLQIRGLNSTSSSYAEQASVTRLLAAGPDPLTAVRGITLGGYWYAAGGAQQGTAYSEQRAIGYDKTGMKFGVYMPPGSAALVRLRRLRRT